MDFENKKPSIPEEDFNNHAKKKANLPFDITDDEFEAQDIVDSLIESGRKPIITVPEEWITKIMSEGIPLLPKIDLRTRKTFDAIVGRLGVDPFFPLEERRYAIEVNPNGIQIAPRMTGPRREFLGTIYTLRPVPKENLRIIGKFTKREWEDFVTDEDKKASDANTSDAKKV